MNLEYMKYGISSKHHEAVLTDYDYQSVVNDFVVIR